MPQFDLLVTLEAAGRRLDEFLAARFGALTRMRLANLIAQGYATVNGEVAHAGWRVTAGDRVALTLDADLPSAMLPEAIPLDVIYEDEHLIVVNKPAGLLMHPTKQVKGGTLTNALAYYLNRAYFDAKRVGEWGSERKGDNISPSPLLPFSPSPLLPEHGEAHALIRPGIVHRLDKETSGLVVVAKTQEALSRLTRHFQRRLVSKRYAALVYGEVVEDAGTISAPIARVADRQPPWWVTEGGKLAETRFQVVERRGRVTLLELEPVTGRTNQLRIHCAYIGHPILGDRIYAHEQAATRKGRLCLHACRLAFHHPAGGQWLEFSSPLPGEMKI